VRVGGPVLAKWSRDEFEALPQTEFAWLEMQGLRRLSVGGG
jgi:hypothetical protein